MRQVVFIMAKAARRLSPEKSYRLADKIARLVYHGYPRLRRIALNNLRIAFGYTRSPEELAQIALCSYRNQCRTAIEFLRMPDLSVEEVCRLVSLEGKEHFDAALARGKGVVLLTAHYGNWELMGARLLAGGYPLSVIARDQRDTAVSDLINETRSLFGMRIIKRGNTRDAVKCLRQNEILGILADQHEAGSEVMVDFFGRPAATAIGPAVLALRTGAALIPAFVTRDEHNRHSIRVHPPLELIYTDDRAHDIRENTAQATRIIEQEIARHPEEWLWVHRRWKTTDG